jgi:hypothetical protein
MSFFDIFRKKEVPIEVKEISLGSFEEEVSGIIKGCEKIEIGLMDLAFKIRKDFYDNLVEKINVLKNVDLEERKEDLRLKGRVLEGKESYVNHCDKLVERVLKLNEMTFESYFKEISALVSRFEKDSFKNYNIANVLIGKEIAEVRGAIKDFFKLNEKMFFDNKDVFSKKRFFGVILEKYASFKDSVNLRENMENGIKSLDKETEEKRITLKKTEKDFLDFKHSDRFKNFIEWGREREEERKALFNQAEILKEKIDFKGLLGVYHKNEKKKNLLRDYKDNFVRALVEDSQNSFLEVFEKDLARKMAEIKRSLINLDKEVFSEIVDEKNSFDRNIEQILRDISSLETKKGNSEKLLGKLKSREKDKLEELKEGLGKFNFHLKD